MKRWLCATSSPSVEMRLSRRAPSFSVPRPRLRCWCPAAPAAMVLSSRGYGCARFERAVPLVHDAWNPGDRLAFHWLYPAASAALVLDSRTVDLQFFDQSIHEQSEIRIQKQPLVMLLQLRLERSRSDVFLATSRRLEEKKDIRI